jgi:hypothetical protein
VNFPNNFGKLEMFVRTAAFIVVALALIGASGAAVRGDFRQNNPESGPCARSLAQHAVCEPANEHAVNFMNANNLTAVSVMQDVATGALIVAAASDPRELDFKSPLPPLSVVKLFTAASWWNHETKDEFQLVTGKKDFNS